MFIGYARVSTSGQDLTGQTEQLVDLGVEEGNVHVDHGYTGGSRSRPGLQAALAGTRTGDTLVVTKLDRLARSVTDARDIADELTRRGVRLSLGSSAYDPLDPMDKLLFNVLGIVAEFEADLIRARTREGMVIARSKGRLRGKQPKLTAAQEKHLVGLYEDQTHTTAEIAELFGVARSTVYRALERAQVSAAGG